MNRFRGEAPVPGTDHILVFDANAFCDIEEAAGLKIGDLSTALQSGIGMSLLRTLLWAGLQHKQPGTTVRDAGEVISTVGIEAATAALTGALTAAFQSAGGNGGTPAAKKPVRGGTGSAS